MNHDELKALCALYVLDALGPDDRGALEEHLAEGCSECERELAELLRVGTALAASVPQVEPDPAVKSRLMARMRRRAVIRSVPVWFPAAAAALALIFLGWQTLQLRQQVARQQLQIADLSGRLESQVELSRLLASAASRIIELAGTDVRPGASARVLWDTDAQMWYLYVSNLAPLPEDQTYQLWFIVGDQPHSAGILRTDEAGSAFARVELPPDLVDVAGAAVSLEPAGGVPQPTGPIVLLGNV